MGRVELAHLLAARLGGAVETYATLSKVPVPAGLPPPRTIALIEDVTRHHQATLRGLSPDFAFFYLEHRAARWSGGPIELTIVHDNTLAGGERVAELVTRPLWRGDLAALEDALGVVGALDGVSIPETAALHVHLDGAPFCSARALLALIDAYAAIEPELPARVRTPAALRRAAPLPPALRAALTPELPWAEVEAMIRAEVPHRGFALNLYNLAAGEPDKLTVELKLAGSSLDGAWVREVRELYVELGLGALEAAAG